MSNQVGDVRDVRDWSHVFKNDQFIEYTDAEGDERVLNKSEYLKSIISYLRANYFESLFQKKKTVSLGKAKEAKDSLSHESLEDLSMEYWRFTRLINREEFYTNGLEEEELSDPDSPGPGAKLDTSTSFERTEMTSLLDDSMTSASRDAERERQKRGSFNSPKEKLDPGKPRFQFQFDGVQMI